MGWDNDLIKAQSNGIRQNNNISNINNINIRSIEKKRRCFTEKACTTKNKNKIPDTPCIVPCTPLASSLFPHRKVVWWLFPHVTPRGIWEQRQYAGKAHTANVSWPQPEIMETRDKHHPWQQGQPGRGRAAAQLSSVLRRGLRWHSGSPWCSGLPCGPRYVCRRWCDAGLQS